MSEHYKLLIDQECPMCAAYGACFTKLQFLQTKEISSYQTINSRYTTHIDMERAKDEIALLQLDTNEAIYGLDSILHIIGIKLPLVKKLGKIPPIYFLLKLVYLFISYNRKVIIPGSLRANGRVCNPSRHIPSRISYIMLVGILTGYILNTFNKPLLYEVGIYTHWSLEYFICFGQIFWQLIIVYALGVNKKLDYLGNMSTVSMVGGLMLVLGLGVESLLGSLSFSFRFIYFFSIVFLMLCEHIRRCQLLGITGFMSFSWVLYRMVALAIIIKMFYL